MALGGGVFACSEPVPPAAQGAFIGNFQAGTAGMCGQDIHTGQIGYADATEIRDLKKEGTAGARVFCSVTPNGNGFDVEGALKQLNTDFVVKIGGMPTNATEDAPHHGSVSYRTAETLNYYTSTDETPCDFWMAPPVPGKAQQEVAAGRIWVQYKCDSVKNASSNTECRLGPGSTLAFQNCDQGDEE
jgi:hypothetical protein